MKGSWLYRGQFDLLIEPAIERNYEMSLIDLKQPDALFGGAIHHRAGDSTPTMTSED